MYSVLTSHQPDLQKMLLARRESQMGEPSPNDVWLFTDPAAKEKYARQGLLDRLESDIRNYVMYNGRWSSDELQYKREVERLQRACVLTPKNSFGHLSPHPTIYSAEQKGAIVIGGVIFNFDVGDEIVFEPWLSRVSHPGLAGPLRIGRLDTVNRCFLSDEAFPQCEKYGNKDFVILHQILYCPKS
jgi:hypothetical protein